jgi:hypothetical protein
MEAKTLASKLVRDDGDFTRTFLKLKKIAEEVGFNDTIIGENDTFRLEQKLTQVLYLVKTK